MDQKVNKVVLDLWEIWVVVGNLDLLDPKESRVTQELLDTQEIKDHKVSKETEVMMDLMDKKVGWEIWDL